MTENPSLPFLEHLSSHRRLPFGRFAALTIRDRRLSMSYLDELKSKRICSECFGEAYLSNLTDTLGSLAKCDYCGSTEQTFSINEMADQIETAFGHQFERTYDQPTDLEWIMQKETEYERSCKGDSTVDAIGQAAIIDQGRPAIFKKCSKTAMPTTKAGGWERRPSSAQVGTTALHRASTHIDLSSMPTRAEKAERAISARPRTVSRSGTRRRRAQAETPGSEESRPRGRP